MPLEAGLLPLGVRAAELNAQFRHHSAMDVVAHTLSDPMLGPVALVSSFGAEAVVLLHMVATADRTTPVLFLDTEMLFPETLTYQAEVSETLGLTDVRIIRPERAAVLERDVDGILHLADTGACCALRKTEPLEKVLSGFDAWITGRKRFHGGEREALDFFEAGPVRIKINPLAHWTRADVADYMLNNRLPRHPLVTQRFPSIGCAPCTTKAAPDEDLRAGRWRTTDKDECGIHFVNGRPLRGPLPQEDHP